MDMSTSIGGSGIFPFRVLLPMLKTMPTHDPSVALVLKKTRFAVSRGFSLVNSAFFGFGSESLVRLDWSTFWGMMMMVR